MKWSEKVRVFLFGWWLGIEWKATKIKRRVWNKRILLWWYRLWIRKNEFHCSLEMDAEAMIEMNEQERNVYLLDLLHRRRIAHKRDLSRTIAKNMEN